MEHIVKFGSRSICFQLEYSNRKTLGIKVYPDNKVEVSAPIFAEEVQVLERIRRKAPWILKQLDTFNSYKPLTRPRKFVNGETHLYLGRQHRLKIVRSAKNDIKAYRGQLWVYSRHADAKALQQQLEQWYKLKAHVIFNELLAEAFLKFRRYQITTPALIIRTMSTRWGSCTASGKIILNPELIKAPKGCIHYVIVHELCHLVHHNHTKAFQTLLNRILPEWKKWKDKLERILA